MKKYIEFIGEAKKNLSLEDQWWDAIDNNAIKKVKSLIKKGIDVNILHPDSRETALKRLSFRRIGKNIINLLLQHL